LISRMRSITFPFMRAFPLLFIAALLLPPVSLGQAGTGDAAKLESVQVTGSARFRSEQVAAAIGLHPGAMVTRDDLQKAANDLAQLGVFSSVQYRYTSLDTGVRAEYQVKDLPGVLVSFDNFPWFSDDQLIAAIQKSGALFDGNAPTGGTVLDAISGALEKLIASRGVFSRVSHVMTTAALSGAQTEQFHVEQSDVKVAAVDFSDAVAQNDHAIHTRLTDVVGQPYSRALIDIFEVEQVRPVYLAHAFLHVRFVAPICRFPEGVTGAAAKNATVVVGIEPGPAFVWGGVSWSGNSAISTLDLQQFIPLHQGDAADGTKIEAGWESVRTAYRHLGYLDADVKPVGRLDDSTRQATYTGAISEGPRYRMGKLILTGLSVEGERRIRAAWKIAPGAVFDDDIFQEFLSHGITQAFAGLPVHYDKIGHFLQTNPATATVDVLMDFQ